MSNLPSPIAAVAAAILANPAPILALDACSILDLIRSQHRIDAPANLIQLALKAIQAATATPLGLHIVIVEQVAAEYQSNSSTENQLLSKHFRTLSNTGSTLLHKSQATDWQTGLSAIQSALSALPDNLIAASCTISHDASCTAKAALRLYNGIAPGRRGSANVADCVIVEHILELMRKLRDGGFPHRCAFVSRNTRDFGAIGQPKPPLDIDFTNLGIDYLPDIEAAMGTLGF